METAIRKFENHHSVQIVRENVNLDQDFNFKQVELGAILKCIKI